MEKTLRSRRKWSLTLKPTVIFTQRRQKMTAVTELWWCPTFCIWKCHQLEVILPPRGELNRVHEGIRRAPNERTPREANIRKSALDAHSFVSLTLRRLIIREQRSDFFFFLLLNTYMLINRPICTICTKFLSSFLLFYSLWCCMRDQYSPNHASRLRSYKYMIASLREILTSHCICITWLGKWINI